MLPLFGDQYDNAQRIRESGLGERLDPYRFEEKELLNAIHKLINDEKVKEKLKVASARILNSRKHEELADKIEQFLCKN